jgi:hypothetical protein
MPREPKTKKQQRFVTVSSPSGQRVGVDLAKVETVRLERHVLGLPGYHPYLLLRLASGQVEVSEDETGRVLELLGLDAASLELEEMEEVS